MKLNERLGDILVKIDKNTNIDEVIVQIRQAFIDAGYITPSVMDLCMDGQQWYDRFKQELVADKTVSYNGDMLAVARRTANIMSREDQAKELLGDNWEDFKEYVDGIDNWDMSDVERYINR